MKKRICFDSSRCSRRQKGLTEVRRRVAGIDAKPEDGQHWANCEPDPEPTAWLTGNILDVISCYELLSDYKMQTASSVLIASDDQWWQVGSITSAQTGFTFR